MIRESKWYQLFDKSLGNAGAFRTAFLACTIFYCVNFVDCFFWPLTVLLGIWAIFVLINQVVFHSVTFHIRHWKSFTLFLLAVLAATLVNWQSNLLMNLFTVGYSAFYFIVFLGSTSLDNPEKIRLEMRRVMRTIVVLVTALTLLGFLVLTRFLYIKVAGCHFGFYDGRLNGVFNNPNLGGFLNALSIVCAQILFFMRRKSGRLKEKVFIAVLIWVSIAVNLVALWFTDSYAALVLLAGYYVMLASGAFISRVRKWSALQILKQAVIFGMAAVVIYGGSFYLRNFVQNTTANAIMYVVTDDKQLIDNISGPLPEEQQEKWKVALGSQKRSLGSGRMKMIKQGLTIYKNKPILGVGPENIKAVGDQYLDEPLKYADLHNAYLTVLAGTGTVGFITCCIFFIQYLYTVLKTLFNRTYRGLNKGILPYIVAFLFSYGIYAFAEKALLFHIDFTTAIFWVFMGYAMNYVLALEKEKTAAGEKDNA